jgi:hypothetical protein
MNTSDKIAFAKSFAEMALCYGQTPADGTMEAYFKLLQHLSIKAVLKGMVKALGDSPVYFPTAPLIRAHAESIEKTLVPYRPPVQMTQITGKPEVKYEPTDPQAKFCYELANVWRQDIIKGTFKPPSLGQVSELLDKIGKTL